MNKSIKIISAFLVALFLLLPMAAMAAVPFASHVFVVVEENHSYSSVVNNASMPYLNSLIRRYGLATQYYADTHPSIGNYFMLTVGKVVTNNDAFSALVTEDNIVRELVRSGKTWRSYAEGLPSVGYVGNGPGRYARKHNPFSYLSDVVSDSTQRRKATLPGSFFIPCWTLGTVACGSALTP